MRYRLRRFTVGPAMIPRFATLALTVLIAAAAPPAHADEAKPSPIRVASPWLRATPKGAPVVGGYATITNTGSAPDRLVGASIDVAARAEVHTMAMADGVMHMRKLDDGLAVAPGATLTLAPGGDHLMFFTPSAPIREGQSVRGTVVFAKAGAVPVTFAVAAIGATVAPGAPAAVTAMPGMGKGMETGAGAAR